MVARRRGPWLVGPAPHRECCRDAAQHGTVDFGFSCCRNVTAMPLSFTIDHKRRFVHVRGDGQVGLKDVEAFFDALVVENALPYRKLVDSRNAVASYIDADLVQLAARIKLYAHIDRRGAVAVVANAK